MTKIVLAGFEPFSTYRDNSSWDVAQALAIRCRETHGPSLDIREVRLPVAFEEAHSLLLRLLDASPPEIVLLLGLRADAPFLEFERIALNVGEADFRETGTMAPFALGEGEAARHTPVDLPAMAEKIREAGIPARVSHYAGTYLCNAVYYHALDWASHQIPSPKVVFAHMPLLPEQAAAHYTARKEALPSISLELAVRGFAVALDEMIGNAG